MPTAEPDRIAVFELPTAQAPAPPPPEQPRGGAAGSLPEPLLLRNLVWFCWLRWVVVAILLAFGTASLFPAIVGPLGLRSRILWPFLTAGVLGAMNLIFHARLLIGPFSPQRTGANLWSQIVLDLVVLTAVVHFTGSLETYVAFAYLFHIVLACIFFSSPRSLVVTLLAGGLYAACVGAETAGLLPAAGIYASDALRMQIVQTPPVPALYVLSALGIWLVVWYLTSALSALVRERDHQLAVTNRQLAAAQQERTRHMLRTTHELKSPFAAIHANAQLLLGGHCGELPQAAVKVAARISTRCRRLAAEIQEMLQLANLQSGSGQVPHWENLDLDRLAEAAAAQLRALAEERAITIDVHTAPAPVFGVSDHVTMMLTNLIANAVNYSREGGQVEVECRPAEDGAALLSIQDHGIGIRPEKLPHIFEEFYRTDEAVRHNRESTGLGLAIVQQVAQSHGVKVRVESAVDVGTRFTLEFPPGQAAPGAQTS
jgi:signal transduction histidine kinase